MMMMMMMQGLIKTDDAESIRLLPKSSSSETAAQDRLTRNQWNEVKSKAYQARSQYHQPVQQRSEVTITDTTSAYPN